MKRSINWKAVFVALLATFACVMLIQAVGLFVDDWTGFRQSTNATTPFNEEDMGGYIRQPWNTVSSLGYVFVGVYILCLPCENRNRKSLRMDESFPVVLLFAIATVVTGVGSTFFHMSLTFVGQTCDVVGMYLLSVFLILYAFRNQPKMTSTLFYVSYTLSNLILLVILIFLPELRRYLFAGMIVVGLLLEYFFNRKLQFKYILIATNSLLLGYIIWQLDNMKIFFPKTGPLQGHAIWHLLGAVSCWFLYRHYIFECETQPQSQE